MTDLLRILLVEDSPTDAKLVLRELASLGRPLESRRVEDEASFRSELRTHPWDAVVCDWSMPTFSGPRALEVFEELGLDIPLVILSGTVGEEFAVAAMRAGARDYVLKDKVARLVPALRRELREADHRAAHRETAAKLRARDARLRALVENSQDGILLTSREGATLYMSPSARRILGVAEGVDTRAFDLVLPEDRPAILAAVAKLLEQPPDAHVSYQFRVTRPDGSLRDIQAVATNRLAEPGLEAIVVNFQDVTESRAAREALRVSEVRFQQLSESGIIGICVADLGGSVREANDAFLKMLGYARDELVAGQIQSWALTPPERRGDRIANTARLDATGMLAPQELTLQRQDGTPLTVLLGAAMVDERSCIAFLADLTSQKAAEEALRKSEAQLRQAQKMEAIGGLAAGVAHDFNNLLSVIMGYSLILARELKQGDPIRDGLEEITAAGKSAADLTRQLLAFSRQQVLQPRVVDLGRVVGGTERMIRRLIGEDIELAVLTAPGLGAALIDPGQFEQVLMNLVVNARDAMPTGGKLTIETTNVSLDETYVAAHEGAQAGPHVMLAVSDTGSGMDAETQRRIFEPFFTTKAMGKGTGLGLSTVFGIVKQSGGTVWVYSEVGVGTTMKVYFPRTDREREATDVTPGDATGARGGTETILLVEDDPRVRNVTRAILRPLGYNVIEAQNGGDALLVGEQHTATIHLLLTDVIMPRMSGRALAERLQVARPAMKVIFMSGYTDNSIIHHGVLDAGIAFLQKPINPDVLARKVREILDAPAT